MPLRSHWVLLPQGQRTDCITKNCNVREVEKIEHYIFSEAQGLFKVNVPLQGYLSLETLVKGNTVRAANAKL